MKKFISKVLPVCVIVIVIFLILLVLLSHDSEPSYRFLGGRKPITCKMRGTQNEDIRYIYSFEADFNDVCSKAEAELFDKGFVVRTLPGDVYWEHTTLLREIFRRNPFNIRIYNNHMYIEKDDAIGPKDGWIVVEIGYWPNQWFKI